MRLPILDNTTVSLEKFGGGTNITDNAAAMNAAIEYIEVNEETKTLVLGIGHYRFKTAPNPINVSSRINTVDQGVNNTVLLREYIEPEPGRGVLHFIKGSNDVGHFSILAGVGTHGGCAIGVYSSNTDSSDFSNFHDLNISINGQPANWAYCMVVDGTLRSGNLISIRDLRILNCDFFAAVILILKIMELQWCHKC